MSKKPVSTEIRLTKGIMAKTLTVATAAVIAVFALFAFYNDTLQRETIRNETAVLMDNIGKTTANSINNWLQGRMTLIASSTEFAKKMDSDTDPLSLFSNQTYLDNFQYSYIGMEKTGEFFIWPVTKMADDYDPRKRPWYKDAVAKGGPVLTAPYVDASTKDLIISAAHPVKTSDGLLGVAAGDFSIKSLVQMLSQTDLDGKGHAFLVSKEGKILVHSNIDYVDKDLSVAYPNGAPAIRQEMAEVEDANGTSLMTFVPIEGLPVEWYVALSMDKNLAYASLSDFRMSAAIAATLAAILMIIVLGFFLTKLVAMPISNMTSAMGRLAHGDNDVEIDGLDRQDEIGAMAEAVMVFKQNAIEQDRLRAQQAKEEQAKQQRVELVDQLISEFDLEVSEVLKTISVSSSGLETTAGSLNSTAEASAASATTVAAASEEASINVRSVAAASEELAASISEISRRVNQSREIAERASGAAKQTDQTVQSLVSTTDRISQIVSLINDIAAQTNLLALNATIEAARAGEAGKGFAVVASEVKSLADQTSKATDEIATQISAMQSVSNEAAGAIRGIGDVIVEINEIASEIAASVDQQGGATREIAHNVNEAAKGTQEVSESTVLVTKGASDTEESAANVLSAALDLSGKSSALRDTVQNFVNKIRAA
ncbi:MULTISPECIES: methyl-accepting chemotaxis protein [Cohaesibacter]|uniref:methyl-accepting chemotaxis protein n=1 Tax=Cohaesibacter TaxID=655352 RepID=UPI000DE81388|nr:MULTISPECIES: methyl-accepting chemotaxis protein [Cohaesibacter]TLP43434.1 methyl-accepting chemotaxis protein [Cohaesibacter sp. CAU 1516]